MGTWGSMPYLRQTPESTPASQRLPLSAHGMIPPSDSDFRGSSTRSGSISILCPKPSQVGHAPYGELNENIRGESSSKLMPQSTQANLSEKSSSSEPTTSMSTIPSARFS